jgi:hypothetical protein
MLWTGTCFAICLTRFHFHSYPKASTTDQVIYVTLYPHKSNTPSADSDEDQGVGVNMAAADELNANFVSGKAFL